MTFFLKRSDRSCFLVSGPEDPVAFWPGLASVTRGGTAFAQCSPLSLVEECRGLALIGRELHSVATPALLCHKEPAQASKVPTGLCLLLAGSLWYK